MADEQPVPVDLAAHGRAVWTSVTSEYDLSRSELSLLAEVCRTADELAVMRAALGDAEATVQGSTGQVKAHPLFLEVRAHRLVLAKLWDQLALPAEYDEVGLSPRQQSAKKAADTRWSMERARWGKGGKAS